MTDGVRTKIAEVALDTEKQVREANAAVPVSLVSDIDAHVPEVKPVPVNVILKPTLVPGQEVRDRAASVQAVLEVTAVTVGAN